MKNVSFNVCVAATVSICKVDHTHVHSDVQNQQNMEANVPIQGARWRIDGTSVKSTTLNECKDHVRPISKELLQYPCPLSVGV